MKLQSSTFSTAKIRVRCTLVSPSYSFLASSQVFLYGETVLRNNTIVFKHYGRWSPAKDSIREMQSLSVTMRHLVSFLHL